MLKIEVKPGESIERALKRYKRKYRNTKRLDEIRDRQEFTKKSVEKSLLCRCFEAIWGGFGYAVEEDFKKRA